MKVLVTGGTGVIGKSTVEALHDHGHTVRVLSRHAGRDEKWWPAGVEGWAGDITNEKSVRGSAQGCEAIIHLAGVVDEEPPERTFQRVNIDGTRYIVLEAERSGVKKVVYVSSLGADRGRSGYQKSKLVAEDVVRAFTRDWVVVRPGAVYGPGDEHMSVLLQMVRTLPIVPTIGDGNQKFQPIWHEDLAKALVMCVERSDIRCAVLELAGSELTSQNELVARFRALTGRKALQAPLPEVLASWGIKALDAIGIDAPAAQAEIDMLGEGNVIPPERTNALTDVFGIAPTRLDDGLRRMADEQPEQLPSEGVGALTRKRYWADIEDSRYDPDGLFAYVRDHLLELMPRVVQMKAEPYASTEIEEGETLTLEIPMRGHVQVRVAEVMDRRITLLTVVGHPIAGAVRFLVEQRGTAVRFEVQTYDRPATAFDRLMLRTIGGWAQRGTWMGLVTNVTRASGGRSKGVQTAEEELDDRELALVEEWASTLSAQLSRNTTSSGRD